MTKRKYPPKNPNAMRKNAIKNEDKYISFYKICRELLEEKEKEFTENRLTNFRKEQQDRFIEILTQAGIDPDTLRVRKNGPFQIPTKEKEFIKSLLRDYTTPVITKIRRKDFKNITSNELTPLIERIDPLLDSIEDPIIRLRERSKLYATTSYILKQASEEAYSHLEPLIQIDTTRFNPDIEKAFILNDSDAAYLLQHYKVMLEETSRRWNELVEIVGELREEELMNILDTDGSLDKEIDIDDKFIQRFEEISTLVQKATQIRKNTLIHRLLTFRNKPSSEKLDQVRELIQEQKNRKMENP